MNAGQKPIGGEAGLGLVLTTAQDLFLTLTTKSGLDTCRFRYLQKQKKKVIAVIISYRSTT